MENPYASTRPPEIEPAAKKVHMISEKILAPEEAAEQPPAAEAPEEAPEKAPPSGETGEEQA